MTEDIAKRGIVRAYRADDTNTPANMEELRVIGKGFDITWSRY